MAKEKKEETAVNTDKLKALQAAMEKIEKSYGKGAIMTLGNDHIENIEVIPTGSIGLNAALGVGGYPRGRVVEIYGPESSGKTTLAIHAIAEAQKMGALRLSSMRSMPSTGSTRKNSVSTSTTFSFRSPTAASRRLKSRNN